MYACMYVQNDKPHFMLQLGHVQELKCFVIHFIAMALAWFHKYCLAMPPLPLQGYTCMNIGAITPETPRVIQVWKGGTPTSLSAPFTC